MHWHAIRQSNGHAENQGLPSSTHLQQLDENSMSAEAESETHETSPPIPEGDDACDLRSNPDELALHTVDSRDSSPGAAIDDRFVPFVGEVYTRASLNSLLMGDRGFDSESRGPGAVPHEIVDPLDPPSPPPRIGERPTEYYRPESPASSRDGSTTYTDKPWLKVGIPWAPANNLMPYAYHRVLQNRIDDAALLPGHRYDIKAYTPTFLYDCLVLPGSLANVRGKGSAEDMIFRMTPALLPGFGAYYWPHNHEPCILPSTRPGDYVQGMVVFGQSKQTRRNIHEFYRENCKRIKVEVEFEVLWPVPPYMKTHPSQAWLKLRRRVWAHTWIWKDAKPGDVEIRVDQEEKLGWRYDDYLAYEMNQGQKEALKIVPAGWIEDDRESVASDESLEDMQMEDGEGTDEGWEGNGQDETGSWEEGSGAGAAAEWDEVWAALPEVATDEAGAVDASGGEEDFVGRGALDRDYERNGSAGMW